MPKCFSKCRGMKEIDCKDPCSFIAKKYCRLSGQYKMDPPGCEVVKKGKAKPQPLNESKPLAKRTVRLKTSSKKATLKSPTIAKNNTTKSRATRLWSVNRHTPKEFAAKTIQTFMKKTEGKRKALFLQSICSDSGLCIAFGKETKKLMDFFEFEKFTYATFPTVTIGKPSGNGFVKQILYKRENYQAYAVLKSSIDYASDNLAYEYLVGKYLNEKSKKIPVFLETYGLFLHKDSAEREHLRARDRFISELTPLDPYDVKNVCTKSSTECILIQHLKDARTLYDMKDDGAFFLQDSAYVLYHVYFALHQLREEFTHYDLHTGNVLLYEPIPGKHIEYHYHLPNETVVFCSKYMVKIIDYGRCFFSGSPEYHEKLMAESSCNRFQHTLWFPRKDRTRDDAMFFINPYYKNESHDLRLMRSYGRPFEIAIGDAFANSHLGPYIELFKKIVYENVRFPDKTAYGTKEDLTHDDNIRNVTDAEDRLRKWITQSINKQLNRIRHPSSKKLGEFHIYSDGRDMVYKPV